MYPKRKFSRFGAELLAPAGDQAALMAAIEAGADAVYLGGKHFNMRMHRAEMNFADDALKDAIGYAHGRGVKVYVTLNNLLSTAEIAPLKDYLAYLAEISPDALLVQDLAVLKLAREMKLKIPLHASVMLNTHSAAMVRFLQDYGVSRIVASREMTLAELALLKERTGIETEYFIHGDMCIAESGQCVHSGVLFGHSGSRGRCLKMCRWPYRLIDEANGEKAKADNSGAYKLAMKDMCLYRHLPALIQAGVDSFKIEGRMRPAEFIGKIVGIYRRAIDDYLADPSGYEVNEAEYAELYKSRARDFSTVFAFGQPTAKDIGDTGEREPRFFSRAVAEAAFADEVLKNERPIEKSAAAEKKEEKMPPLLTVRVADLSGARAAINSGADIIYIGGEIYRPNKPWKLADIEAAADAAHESGKKAVLRLSRTTTERELDEFAAEFSSYLAAGLDGFMVGNIGGLKLLRELLPRENGKKNIAIQGDIYLNTFNPVAAAALKEYGATLAAASIEMSFSQLRDLAENSPLPIEAIVHGAYESMICDHDFPALSLGLNELDEAERLVKRFALIDEAGEIHALRRDQFGRTHILFAKDLCLYPYLEKFFRLAAWRIEAQDYTAAHTAKVVKCYREKLDVLAKTSGTARKNNTAEKISAAAIEIPPALTENAPRKLGIGAYRLQYSLDSL